MAALAENQHLSDKQQLEGHGSPKAANAKVRGTIRTGAENDADRGTVQYTENQRTECLKRQKQRPISSRDRHRGQNLLSRNTRYD